jgi:hypothetical protein
MEVKKPTAEQMAKFKKNAQDQSLSAEVRAKFQAIVDKFSEDVKDVEDKIEGKAEPKKRAGRKPAPPKSTKKPSTPRGTKKTASDIEKAKAEIKAKTGKTEEECEAIIEQYRELRTKAQQGKIKAEQANADNKKRVEKLDQKGDLIEGTNIKTADAVIESTAKDVAEKIEQQIEAVEEKAEKEAKAEVAKDNTIKTPKDKKEAVKEKVDEKVKKETKIVVERVVIDTSSLLTSIATSLGKFDKDSQKEFLIKLRSDIDKLLAKYAFGGMTDGAVQTMNVQQSNMSSSSVNPTMFAKGGSVSKWKNYDKDHLINIENGMIVLRGTNLNDIKPKDVKGFEKLGMGKYANGGGVEYVSWEITFFDDYDTQSFVLDVQGDFDNEQDAIDEVVREYDIYVDKDNYGQMYYNGNPVDVSDAKRVIEHRKFKEGGGVEGLQTEIHQLKRKLVAQAKSKGISENFGQKEVRMLNDKYPMNYSVGQFDEWVQNFDLDSYAKGGGVEDEELHYWEVSLKMPNGEIVYESVIADSKEDAEYYGELTDSANEGAKVLSVKSMGKEKYADGGEVDDSKNKKIMESYREWVFDLRNQSYPKMSVSQAIKEATEYMYSYYSKEELIEAIKNDRQIEMFGMENTWLNALNRAKKPKMAQGGGVASRTKVEVGDEKIAVIKNGKEVKGYPVYVTTQGYSPQTIGVFETKEQAEKKAMQIRKKNKYANGGKIATNLSLEETRIIANATAKALGKDFKLTEESLEGASFDLDFKGEPYDGGSYLIFENGDVINYAVSHKPIVYNYKTKKKFADGGMVGQEIVFDYQGEEKTGVIKDVHNSGDYIVSTDDGRTLLAQRDLDVISLGAMRQQGVEQRKKRFGFFGEGGNVSDLDYSDILAVLEDKLTDAVANDIRNTFENSYNAEGEEVEHQSRDGFIAYTDGGFEVRWFEYLSGFWGSGYSLPTSALDEEKERQIDYSLEMAKEYFIDQYPEIVEELGEDNINYNSLYEAGYESEAEELSEAEMENMDGTIMCEVGAYYYTPNNDRGIEDEHTIRLFGLVNLESPYHRNGNLEDRYDIDITFNSIEELEEILEIRLKEITDWFNGSNYDESTDKLRISRMAKGGGVKDKLSYTDFVETLRDNDKINAYTGKETRGMEMYYLPSGHPFLGLKFFHKNKRKAYNEYVYIGNKIGFDSGLNFLRMAKGGLTEHGLEVGDSIIEEFSDDEIGVRSSKGDFHRINLDKGQRFAKGGKLWIDTKGKGGLKGVKPSRKNTFRNEAVKRNMTSGQLASKVLANPSRYKGINPKSAQLVKNMGVRKQGGSIGDILRNRRGE